MTLHRTGWFKPFLPLEIKIHSGWVAGCDMRLSARQRDQGGKLWVLPQIKAEHLCPEVLRLLAGGKPAGCRQLAH